MVLRYVRFSHSLHILPGHFIVASLFLSLSLYLPLTLFLSQSLFRSFDEQFPNILFTFCYFISVMKMVLKLYAEATQAQSHCFDIHCRIQFSVFKEFVYLSLFQQNDLTKEIFCRFDLMAFRSVTYASSNKTGDWEKRDRKVSIPAEMAVLNWLFFFLSLPLSVPLSLSSAMSSLQCRCSCCCYLLLKWRKIGNRTIENDDIVYIYAVTKSAGLRYNMRSKRSIKRYTYILNTLKKIFFFHCCSYGEMNIAIFPGCDSHVPQNFSTRTKKNNTHR